MDFLIESRKSSIILQYAYIITLYSRNVMKSIFIVMLILGVAAMLVIPSAPTQVVKASTAQCSTHNGHNPIQTRSESGSCASATFSTSTGWLKPGRGFVGGSQSSCNSGSIALKGAAFGQQKISSNGDVSCRSHSP
jgi:hypothetical protein